MAPFSFRTSSLESHPQARARKAIFITGAASGIGRETAKFFSARGWFVGLADIDAVGLGYTAALLAGAPYSKHVMDVRSREHWKTSLAAFSAASGGRLDVMFSNAGVGRSGLFADIAAADQDLVVDVNFKGVLYGAEAARPYLKQTPGSCLLNTCSASGLYGTPGFATYAATKFAVRGLSEALEIEWADDGIKVRTLIPSFIDTPLLARPPAGSDRPGRDSVVESGLGFTPVEDVAQGAWNAIHGSRVHTAIGTTATRMTFLVRWMPWLVRAAMLKAQRSETERHPVARFPHAAFVPQAASAVS